MSRSSKYSHTITAHELEKTKVILTTTEFVTCLFCTSIWPMCATHKSSVAANYMDHPPSDQRPVSSRTWVCREPWRTPRWSVCRGWAASNGQLSCSGQVLARSASWPTSSHLPSTVIVVIVIAKSRVRSLPMIKLWLWQLIRSPWFPIRVL